MMAGRGRADVISRMLAVISYRRADSQDIAGRIGDHLRRRFGDRQVFLDTGSIPAGADFRHTIQEAMRRRGVLVAIVGPDWIGARNGATNRIDDPDDPVRMEIAAALDNGLPIIPVLVNGASMPTANELPDDLKDFSYRNALTIDRGRNFHRDADDLIREIEALAPRGAWRRRAVAALVAAAAALVVGWFAVPDSAWHGLLRTVSAPVGDIEVTSFRTPQGRPEFEFLRQKVERNFVDLFSDAKLRVRSALTTNSRWRRRTSRSPAASSSRAGRSWSPPSCAMPAVSWWRRRRSRARSTSWRESTKSFRKR